MKIKSINIKKFRQLENVFEENVGLINELYGSNGSGKTSFISFITWLLYGETLDYGKNDDMNIDTFKPYELIGGEITLFDDDREVVLAREFGYDELGKKTQNFFINGRKVKNQDEYYRKVNECFNLKGFDYLKIKNFNLQRALSDPYYLPNNENSFRELISYILNLDLYNILFNREDNKYISIQKDYNNQDRDYEKCNDFYRQQLKEIEKDLLQTNTLIEENKNVSFNEEEYNLINNEINSLRNYQYQTNVELDNMLKELQDLSHKIIESQNNDIVNRPISSEETECKELQQKYQDLLNQYDTIISTNTNMSQMQIIAKNKIKDLENELANVKNSVFEEIKCPNCNHLINESDYKEFNRKKVEKIKYLKEKIELAKKEKSEYINKIVDTKQLESELDTHITKINALKQVINEKPIEYSSEQTKALKSQFNELNEKFIAMRDKELENRNKIKEENAIKINELQNKLDKLFENKFKAFNLNIYKENKQVLLHNKSTYELRKSLLQEFRLDEIELIKNATSKIFGNDFEFEMLVKNKSNDNYKKVCYASIDGLEHNKSNTAKYLKLSIMLLEKLKSYIGSCDLPIIFDIADNIGKTARTQIFDLIKNSQIFYTRIADDDNVERQLNIIKGE